MDLYYYLWKHRITHKQFAEEIGVRPSSFSVLLRKKHSPTLRTAILIVHKTGGKVGYKDLLKVEDLIKLKNELAKIEKGNYKSE